MPINTLYEQEPNILDKICYIKDYMLKNYSTVFDLSSDVCNYVSIRLNTFPSPDGAKGMFLLVRRNLVRRIPQTNLEKLLKFRGNCDEIERKINANKKQFNQMYPKDRRRLQEKFEFYTYKLLEESEYRPQSPSNINEYDFLITNDIAIEVKSDQWINTGNVSLELLRNYSVSNCNNNISNIGSVLKSTADYWQEYFYEKNGNGCNRFETEVYELRRLQTLTLKIINCLYDRLNHHENV